MSLVELSERLGQALAARSLTICTAESCTGGLLASAITDVPGSSSYFLGGAVTYANAAKHSLLRVPLSYLQSFGAVSPPVALAMARGCAALFGADIALATTGVAGPGGGTSEKPVGLVYIAIVAPFHAACQHFLWPYDRLGNKNASAEAALKLALTWLEVSGSATALPTSPRSA